MFNDFLIFQFEFVFRFKSYNLKLKNTQMSHKDRIASIADKLTKINF